jgi:lysozyme
MLRGFDVAHWQGTVDWLALRDHYDLSFGACKATEGETFHDDLFPRNWAELDAAGLVRMAYHYGHPLAGPLRSADVFLEYVGALQPTDLLVLDLETGDGLTQATVNAWAKDWAARILDRTGRRPVLYTGHAYMENQTGVGLNGPFSAWWYPRYPAMYDGQSTWPVSFNPVLPSPNAWGSPPDWWQYSSTFPSIEGKLDADVYDGTLDQLKGLNMQVDLTPAAVDAVAKRTLTLDGVIRNQGVDPATNPSGAYLTLADMVSNIEDTQDKDHAALATLQEVVDDLGVQLNVMSDKLDTVAADVKALRGLLPGE